MKHLFQILLIFFLSSCTALKSVKKETETLSISEKETVQKTDSIVSIKQNRAIKDNFVFKVPKSSSTDKSTDSILDARLDEILEKLNFQKTSGSNSYKMSYNTEKREIEGSVEVGGTEDKTQITNAERLQTSSESDFLSSTSKKTGIPTMWIIGIIVFLLRSQLFWLLKKLFPVLETLKIVKYFK
ncbi:hypothetical protein N9609_00605 [bacterium]|nr:hypothetical protein [bacterium]